MLDRGHGGHDDASNSSSSSSSSSSLLTPIQWNRDALLPRQNLDIHISNDIGFDSNTQNHHGSASSMLSQTIVLDLRDSQKLTDKGILHLKHLNQVEIAKFDNCHSITGRGLLALSKSHQMHTLTMSNCRSLTDEAIINISHLKNLHTLSLDGCRCLSDISLRALGNLINLRKLDLSQCDLVSDDAIQHLTNIFFLEELSLGWCRRITDKGVEILVQQPGRNVHLNTLSLARCHISDPGVECLAQLKALRHLVLNGCTNIRSVALGKTLSLLKYLETLDVSYCPSILRSSWQGKIDSIKSLDLCYAAVTDVQLSRLSNLPALEEVNFDSCLVGDWALAHFADNNVVPNLVSLNLADCDLTDSGMPHLPKLKKLKHLSLFYCNISNQGLRHLSGMMSLETLNLDSRDISDDGLYHLRNLNLKSLDVFSARITDIGCVHLKRIKSLESLELCGGNVGDLGCAQLASSLKNLTSLNLGHNELITNAGASALASLTNLKALNLSYTRVNAEALRYFCGLRQLQSLALYGCRGVPDSGATDTLHCDLPNLKCLRVNGCGNEGTKLGSSGSSRYSANDIDDDDMSSGDESEDLLSYAAASDEESMDGDVDHDVEGMHLF